MKHFLGLDLGSVSLDCVILDENKNIVYKSYRRTNGRPLKAASELFAEIDAKVRAQLFPAPAPKEA